MYVCVYVCVCMYVCMYLCMYLCMYVAVCMWANVCMYVCLYVRMYVCLYVRMYVCMDVPRPPKSISKSMRLLFEFVSPYPAQAARLGPLAACWKIALPSLRSYHLMRSRLEPPLLILFVVVLTRLPGLTKAWAYFKTLYIYRHTHPPPPTHTHKSKKQKYLHTVPVFVNVSGMRSKSASFLSLRAKMTPPSFKRICIPPTVRYLIPPHCREVSGLPLFFVVVVVVEKTRSWNVEHATVSKSVNMSKQKVKTSQHDIKFIQIHSIPLISPSPSNSACN